MTKINEDVAIQFVKGKDERDLPEIRLFRDIDGKKGVKSIKRNRKNIKIWIT